MRGIDGYGAAPGVITHSLAHSLEKMKVEIWSDLVCPFCYLGKRHFEAGLAQFAHPEAVEIIWRSFELDANTAPQPGQSVFSHLAERKGISLAQSQQMHAQMAAAAAQAGLEYNFDRAVPVNTFLAHQLLHFAAAHGRQNEAKERIFRAYYTEGQHIGDLETLVQLAAELGLPAAEARQALTAQTYAPAVRHDEYQARQIGVRGVPYFVFDDKYVVSGAQPGEVFAEVLQTVWQERQLGASAVAQGAACDADGC